MNRYPIEGYEGDDKYQITFGARPYRPGLDADSKVIDLQAEAMENDPEYRALLFQQMHEESQLASWHAEERIRYIAARRRARASASEQVQS